MQAEALETTRTLLITRESKEYSNVFHMLTDLFNTHLTLRMLGWDDADSSSGDQSPDHESSSSPTRVVLLDNHPVSPLAVL